MNVLPAICAKIDEHHTLDWQRPLSLRGRIHTPHIRHAIVPGTNVHITISQVDHIIAISALAYKTESRSGDLMRTSLHSDGNPELWDDQPNVDNYYRTKVDLMCSDFAERILRTIAFIVNQTK